MQTRTSEQGPMCAIGGSEFGKHLSMSLVFSSCSERDDFL